LCFFLVLFALFFFQAEDGIRDATVTGVQTCALPISPFMTNLGLGGIAYRKDGQWGHLTCFWGFCEVLPDKVNVLAELGERAEDIDVGRAAEAKKRAEERMKRITDEAGYQEARAEYIRAVTRLAVAEHPSHRP